MSENEIGVKEILIPLWNLDYRVVSEHGAKKGVNMRVSARLFGATIALVLIGVTAPSAATAYLSAAKEKFRMPKVVGLVLQDAQDILQSRGSYLLDQEDASGRGRWQLLDSGWKVCAQKPRAGASVPVETVVTLWSVKLSERCP